jgi:hypothetical protein
MTAVTDRRYNQSSLLQRSLYSAAPGEKQFNAKAQRSEDEEIYD